MLIVGVLKRNLQVQNTQSAVKWTLQICILDVLFTLERACFGAGVSKCTSGWKICCIEYLYIDFLSN